MRDLLSAASGTPLTKQRYLDEFWERYWRTGAHGIWKLERAQHFREPGYDVWEAFDRGRWDESMRLLRAGHGQFAADQRRLAEHGTALHWVRVVEAPPTPYLAWNLHVLRAREEHGTEARIVSASQVAALESAGPLPELVVLGATTLYEIRYDSTGTLEGAHRYADGHLIEQVRTAVAALHAAGEPLRSYFDREMAAEPGAAP